mgnify:CR=1 FL=1
MPRSNRIWVIDDDRSIRWVLEKALQKADIQVTSFSNATGVMEALEREQPDAIVSDIRMPGTDGLELFRELQRRQVAYPVVFITGHGDIPLAVSAIKQGAWDFLTKPFREGELLEKVNGAIAHYRSARKQLLQRQKVRKRFESCTPRERDVMKLLADGLPNKGIAEALGISPRTVEIHRAHVMEKMAADSLPTLVRMVGMLDSGLAAKSQPTVSD